MTANNSYNTSVAPVKKEKKYSFTNIDNHNYTEQDYDSMFDNFSGFESQS